MTRCHPEDAYECPHCRAAFSQQFALMNHLKICQKKLASDEAEEV